MRSALKVLLIFVLYLIVSSCQKEPSNPVIIDQTKDFLNEVRVDRVDRSSTYFIRGEFDDKLIYFPSTSASQSTDDTGLNTQFVNNSIGMDQINLIRQNRTNSIQIAIYFQHSNIFNRQFPYFVPAGDGEFAEIELINLKKLWSAPQGSSQNDYTFWNTTYRALKIEVSSLVDSTMEGTFEGYLTLNTGSTIIVKNGYFRIKIKVVDTK